MEIIRALIVSIRPVLPLILGGVAVAILAAVLMMVMIFRAARKDNDVDETGDDQAPQAATEPSAAPMTPAPTVKFSGRKLRQSFSRAIRLLKSHTVGPNFRYKIPWVLLLGEGNSGKTRALDNSGLNLSLDHPFGKKPEVKQPCNWWFFEKGVVLDIAGDMVLGREGAPANERLWRLLLRLLQKHRAERPIDSVVITLPCTDLVDQTGQSVTDFTGIAEKADRLYQKMWQAQKTLGMSFPVYVLVTQCDRIEGFESICHAMPRRFSGEIFGWSSPYGTNTAYTEDWIREAFQEIDSELSLLQYELFTEGTDPKESDGLFLITENIQSLQKPIQVFMDHLFKEGAYHESFIPRGVYFCGGDSDPESEFSKNTFFVRNLFEKKIFPEFGLAKPLKRSLLTRNRKVLALQVIALILVVVGGFGLWRAYSRMHTDITDAMPVFKKVVSDARQLGRAYDVTRSDVLFTLLRQESPFADTAEHLLKNMGKIKTYRSLFFPNSWFSHINENNTRAMVHAFEEIILKGIYFELHQVAKEIFLRAEKGVTEPQSALEITTVVDMPEFLTLQQFIRDLKQLEEYINLYNTIQQSDSVKPLGDLAAFLFGITLDESFYTDSETYLDALRQSGIKRFDPKIFRLKTEFFTIRKLTDRLYEKLFDHHTIDSYLEVMRLQLDEFGSNLRSSADDGNLIRTLLETFDRTEQILQEDRYRYVFADRFDLGDPFLKLLDELGKMEFIGEQVVEQILARGKTAFRKLQTEIKNKQTASAGYLVARSNGLIQNRLSRQALRLRDDLAMLIDQEFMVFEMTPGLDISASPEDQHQWDEKVLNQTVGIFAPYDGFLKTGLENIPSELRHIIIRMAQNGIEKKLMGNISRAWTVLPAKLESSGRRKEAYILSEIRNFDAASGHLATLLEYFDQLDLVDSQHILTQLLYTQIAYLFTAVDSLLDADNLYAIKDGGVAWWNGSESLSLSAFDVIDEMELENHLNRQRKRIEHLAFGFAEPLAAFASATGILDNREEEQTLLRWQRIIEELKKYNSKKPENSVVFLEKFIRFEMDGITPVNYLEKIPEKELKQRSGDLFLRRRNELRRMLYNRCEKIAAHHVQEIYRHLQADFNQNLADRFPFAPISGHRVYQEALPEDIRTFYRLYDDQSAALVGLIGRSRLFGNSGDQALAFLNQMANIRLLFAPYLEGSKESGRFPVFSTYTDDKGNMVEEAPAFDFDVEFRVNREYEIGGNRIIEWQFAAADQVFNQISEKRLGRWRFGDPIRITLRWAKDAKEVPVFAGTHDGIDIDGKTVSFNFDNRWSLLRLLALHAGSIEDFTQRVDPKPHTLKFLIRTRTDQTDAAVPYDEMPETRVFMRATLLTSGQKKQVIAMPFFPTLAPNLTPVAIGKSTFDPYTDEASLAQ
jgi:type VI secretion system protein ImpL